MALLISFVRILVQKAADRSKTMQIDAFSQQVHC